MEPEVAPWPPSPFRMHTLRPISSAAADNKLSGYGAGDYPGLDRRLTHQGQPNQEVGDAHADAVSWTALHYGLNSA